MSSKKWMLIASLGLAMLISLKSHAQQEVVIPMVTDRPDATEAPNLVPKKAFQVETGFAYQKFEDAEVESEQLTYNTTLLRYGLLENLELRLGLDFDNFESTNNAGQDNLKLRGTSPLLLGVKVGITEEKAALPQIGLIGHISHPFTASQDFETANTGVDFRFAFAHTLSEKSSLSYNLGAAWEADVPIASYVYTISYGYGISDKIGAYAELYGDFPENGVAAHFWDAGLTYLISPVIQWDATVGTGISNDQKLLLSTGVSFRLPN